MTSEPKADKGAGLDLEQELPTRVQNLSVIVSEKPAIDWRRGLRPSLKARKASNDHY